MPAAPQPDGVVEDDGPPKTEAEQLQWQIDSTTDEVGGSFIFNYLLMILFLFPLFLAFSTTNGQLHTSTDRVDDGLTVTGIDTTYETIM